MEYSIDEPWKQPMKSTHKEPHIACTLSRVQIKEMNVDRKKINISWRLWKENENDC